MVGNPPWNKPKGGRSTRQKSSTTHVDYCARQNPPVELPFRSPIDQAFIWRSRDFLKKDGRIGLILDTKNFFSQEDQSLKSKRQLFATLRPRAMVNLSALHNKGLFPSAEQPAMVLVVENGASRTGDEVVFTSAERSETFRKHGIVELFLERLHRLPTERIISEDLLLKIAAYGTPRDRAIMRGLFDQCDPLEAALEKTHLTLNTGFKRTASDTPVPPELIGKPMLEAKKLPRF